MTDSLRDQLLGLGFKPAPKPERKPQGGKHKGPRPPRDEPTGPKTFTARPPRNEKPIDPDNPFAAALMGLRAKT